MSCPQIRRALVENLPLDAEQREHLRGCERCSAIEQRRELFLDAVREHRQNARPSADFSARVLARLPAGPDPYDLLAEASLRWLPVGAGLALALGLGVALLPPAEGVAPLAAALLDEDAMVVWILDDLEVSP